VGQAIGVIEGSKAQLARRAIVSRGIAFLKTHIRPADIGVLPWSGSRPLLFVSRLKERSFNLR